MQTGRDEDDDRHFKNDPDPENKVGTEGNIIGRTDLRFDAHERSQERDRRRKDNEKSKADPREKKQDHRRQKTKQYRLFSGFQTRENKGKGLVGDQRESQNKPRKHRYIEHGRDVFRDFDRGQSVQSADGPAEKIHDRTAEEKAQHDSGKKSRRGDDDPPAQLSDMLFKRTKQLSKGSGLGFKAFLILIHDRFLFQGLVVPGLLLYRLFRVPDPNRFPAGLYQY